MLRTPTMRTTLTMAAKRTTQTTPTMRPGPTLRLLRVLAAVCAVFALCSGLLGCAPAAHIERDAAGAGTVRPTATAQRLVFFGTSSCSRCNHYKAQLEAWQVPFVYVDIADEEQSALMWHVVRRARPGYRGSVGIPVIDTGDEVLIAPKYAELKARFQPQP